MESLVWHLKTIPSLQQFKTPFNACCSLVLICKDIIPKYGRTRSKHFFFDCWYVFLNIPTVVVPTVGNKNCFWYRSYVFPSAHTNFFVLTPTAARYLIESVHWNKLENFLCMRCAILFHIYTRILQLYILIYDSGFQISNKGFHFDQMSKLKFQ